MNDDSAMVYGLILLAVFVVTQGVIALLGSRLPRFFLHIAAFFDHCFNCVQRVYAQFRYAFAILARVGVPLSGLLLASVVLFIPQGTDLLRAFSDDLLWENGGGGLLSPLGKLLLVHAILLGSGLTT